MPRFAMKRDDSSNTIYRVVRSREKNTRIEPQNGGISERWPTADLIFVENVNDSLQPGFVSKGVPSIVPVTPLRVLYEWMKSPPPKKIGNSFLHEPLAKQFAEHPKKLVDLFLDSIDDFSRFANPTQPFHGERLVASEDRLRGGTTLLQTMAENTGKIAIVDKQGEEEDAYIYLDREIAPGRVIDAGTTGRNPAGKGGIDFLLARKINGQFIPVVAEVKIKADKTPLLALVQVLTYAAELTSEAQRQRILNTYQLPLNGSKQLHAGMELLLLFVNLPPRLDGILDLTRTIIEKLCADRRFHNHISRIVVASPRRMPPSEGPFQLRTDEIEVFPIQD